MAYNTIMLKGEGANIEELEAYAAITPGMLVELRPGYATVRAHGNDDAFIGAKMFALESELEGNGIADAYSAGDQVRCWHAQPGDLVYALLADGENVTFGDKLSSNGNGYLRKYASPESIIEEAGAIVAIAREAVNRSSSSGADTNVTGRIVVEVI